MNPRALTGAGIVAAISEGMSRADYRKSLGLPDLGLDEKYECPRCGEDRDRDRPDGCRDPDCPDGSTADAALSEAVKPRPRKIVTEHVYPPIPIRQFDWAAHDDNYEPPDSDGVGGGIVGWGRTEAEAIADYLQLVEDEQE